MKKTLLVFSILLSSILLLGQTKIDSLVQIGIQYHDNGKYEQAIEAYKKALKINPKSSLINYELALSYMYYGDYKKSIKHSDFVIKQDDENLMAAYITKASSLDNLGKTDESIELFEKAIKKFGNNYSLLFNLAVNYVKINNYEKAEPALIDAIYDNPNHASSHRLLAIIKREQNQRVQSLLGQYYFLFLEPNSQRAAAAFESLKGQLGGNVQVDESDEMKININVNPLHLESEFSSAEMMIEMLVASNLLEENKGKSVEELFIDNTKSFFNVLGELKEQKDGEGLWWDFYIPFFYKLAQSEYIDVFCHYISLSSNENSRNWIESNIEKFESFENWLNED